MTVEPLGTEQKRKRCMSCLCAEWDEKTFCVHPETLRCVWTPLAGIGTNWSGPHDDNQTINITKEMRSVLVYQAVI